MNMQDVREMERMQAELCAEYGAVFTPSNSTVNSGIALQTLGLFPFHGLRHPTTPDTTGWYLWCGEEFSQDPKFFQPVHTGHVYQNCPEIRRLLGLAPGYRFLLAADYLDVWFDQSLLRI